VIEAFVKQRYSDADYRAYVYNMSHWFRDPLLKNLDEEGIPIQISERFFTPGDMRASLVEKLALAVNTKDSRLSDFERHWVSKAL
jgi:hypothetical protein